MDTNILSGSQRYSLVAGFLRYPDEHFLAALGDNADELGKLYPETARCWNQVLLFFRSHSLHEAEELFIRTFDVQSLCYLDIGYVLFGEDYKRGEFLVRMNEEQKNAGNDCGNELADHLPNMLTLIDKSSNSDLRNELGGNILIPAVQRMVKKISGSNNIYENVFHALGEMLKKDFGQFQGAHTVFPTDIIPLDVINEIVN